MEKNAAAIKIEEPKTIQEIIESRNISHINIGVFDLEGILRGKRISKAKFLSALENGLGFCDVVLGWDSSDKLFETTKFTGWHTGYPDAELNIIPESIRNFPFEENGLLFLADFKGKAKNICPRGVLKRVLNKAKDLGYSIKSAFEYEFFVFNENHNSLNEKNFQNLTPLSPGGFGYSALRGMTNSEIHNELIEICEKSNIQIEGLHTETGPGVLEAAISVSDDIESADKAALFKTITKAFFQRKGLMATFMARWSNEHPGSGGHVHVSLYDKNNKNIFYDESNKKNISALMRHFIAGTQALLPEFTAMLAPNINSYARLVPGFWAPTSTTWGVENRTCAIRAITGSNNSQRIESRIPGADSNPYLALAATLAAGLYGIENKLIPQSEIQGNAYEISLEEKYKLPDNIMDAANMLKKSAVAKEYFSSEFVEHYAITREWEELENRKQITDWQLKRYFEII